MHASAAHAFNFETLHLLAVVRSRLRALRLQVNLWMAWSEYVSLFGNNLARCFCNTFAKITFVVVRTEVEALGAGMIPVLIFLQASPELFL